MAISFHDHLLTDKDIPDDALRLLRGHNISTVAHFLALASMNEGRIALAELLRVSENDILTLTKSLEIAFPEVELAVSPGERSYGYLPELEVKVRNRRLAGG